MLGINKNRLLRIFVYIKNDMSDPFYQNIAPGLAYYFLLSLVPIILLLGQFSGLFSLSMGYLVNFIRDYMPEQLGEFIIPLMESEMSRSGFIANVIFLLTTLYLASRALYALIKISDYAYEIPPPDTKFAIPIMFIKQHVKAVIMTFFMLIIIIAALLVIVFGRTIIDLLLNYLKADTYLIYLSDLWNMLALPLSFCLFFVILLAIYWAMPSKRINIKLVVPGALFAAIGIVVASFGYMIYIKYFANYNIVYGALSSIVILLLWFFIIGYILEFGILLNSAVEKSRR